MPAHDVSTLRALLAGLDPALGERPQAFSEPGRAGLEAVVRAAQAPGALSDIITERVADAAAASGFALFLLAGPDKSDAPCVWVRPARARFETGETYPYGLLQSGLAPERLIQVRAANPAKALQAAGEAIGTRGVGCVVLESWGENAKLDLTATRRLALAARDSGTRGLIVRIAAHPVPSAAPMRWRVRSGASQSPGLGLPGPAALEIELEKYRLGAARGHWRLEWDDATTRYIETALSGAMASLSFDRPDRTRGGTRWARTG